MLLLILPIVCIILIEFFLRSFRPDTASNEKKMRLIRSLELTFFSPFLTVGMLSLKGDNISENFWIVVLLTIVFIGLSVRNYLDYKSNP